MTHTRSNLACRRAFSMLTLLVVPTGCTNLALLDANKCGNLVVETGIGEDCDGGNGCGAPGTHHQCRFTCETDPKSCPESLGYHCGADGVCRQPTGAFRASTTNTTVTTEDMLVGDVNADGCADVIVSSKRATTLHAFASPFSETCIHSEQTLTTSRPNPDPNEVRLPLASLADMDTTDKTSRLSLLSPTRALYGDGLSMNFTNGSPTLSPVLFPRFQRGGTMLRMVSAKARNTGVIVLFEASPDGMTTEVTLISDSQQAPKPNATGYPYKITDIAAVIAADIDPKVNSMPNTRCDEIIIAKRNDTKLEVYQICTDAVNNGFTKLPNSQITLTNTTVRDTDGTIFAADANGDGSTDIITNTKDQKVHIAYGFGDGRFHSLPPDPMMPPPVFDQKANAIINDSTADMAARDGQVFVALEYDSKHPGIDFYAPPCPPLDVFSSPTCAPVTGGCEAVVDDIDGDGDDDVIVSEGQSVDLIIHRQTNGTFNVSFMDTACPPHNLGTGDFDGDGVKDIAFFDQTSKAELQNSTSLSIAYGNAYAAPNSPVMSGRFDEANGLSVVQFGPPGSGSQIGITRAVGPMEKRGSALGVVEVGSDRTVVAPYYITADPMGGQALETFTLIGQTPGKFGNNANPALAVLTKSSTPDLWLVETNADAGSLRAVPKNEIKEIPCTGTCVIAPVARQGTTDVLLLLGDNTGVVYEPADTGFVEKRQFDLKHTFLQTVVNVKLTRYFPRPLVGDIDHDGATDVVVLATTGALVGFFGNADGSFAEVELIKAQSCWDSTTGWAKAGCGNYVVTQIDVDSDNILDLAIAGSELPNASATTSIAAYKVENRSLQLVSGVAINAEKFRTDTDFVALGAADIDGDGVADLVFMPNSNYFTVLRGLPVHE